MVKQLSEADVIPLLERDLARTVGESHVPIVRDFAEDNRGLERDDLAEKLVQDVQQWLHDTFVDTTWPQCREHPNHPMWYKDGSWWCEQSNLEITPLGQLRAKRRGALGST